MLDQKTKTFGQGAPRKAIIWTRDTPGEVLRLLGDVMFETPSLGLSWLWRRGRGCFRLGAHGLDNLGYPIEVISKSNQLCLAGGLYNLLLYGTNDRNYRVWE